MARKKHTRSGIEWKELLNQAGEFFKLALQEIVWVISVHFRVPGACRSGS